MSAWDEYYKKNLAATEEQMKKQIADSDAIYNKQNETVKSIYEGQIGDEEQAYDDLSRQNEVQKYINAREVAENNANLGLTDSGLNRTQQTAVQLSASNNEAKIQRARQSAVEALTREMNAKLADIETSRLSSTASIKSGYEKMASDAATSAYKADVEAETARIKAEQEAKTARIKAQQEAEDALLAKLVDTEITDEVKNEYVKRFVSKYGLTDFLKNYGDEGYRITATGELTNEPISVNEFDMTLYNKNIKANNGNSYISAIASALEQKHKEEGRTFNAQEFLVEMTANSYITPNECSLLLYHYNHGTLSSMYGK